MSCVLAPTFTLLDVFSVAARPRQKSPTMGKQGAVRFEQVFKEHSADVHRLVWRLLGPGANRADVEDLCQQVFLAIHLALKKFRGDSKVSTWVYGIASRIVYRELRRRSRHRAMVRTLEAKAATLADKPPSEPAQETHLRLAEVWRVLMQIHPKKRMVFVLHEIEGLSGPDIAHILNIKEATVHSRLFYARRELIDALEESR